MALGEQGDSSIFQNRACAEDGGGGGGRRGLDSAAT